MITISQKKPTFAATLLMVITLVLLSLSDDLDARLTQGISEQVFNAIQKAQQLAEEKEYAEAHEALNKALERRTSDYERAQLYNVIGRVYFQEEKYNQAYISIKKVIEFNDMPETFMRASLTTLAQLAMMQEDYTAALNYLTRVQALQAQPDANIDILIAQVYISMEDYQAALTPLLRAIDFHRSADKEISENWLLMLNSIYYSQARYSDMIPLLEELIEKFPKKKYIVNLAAIYGQLGDEKKQLLLLEPLDDQGKLDSETLLVNLSNLYVMQGVPFKSAKLLDEAIASGAVEASRRNYEMLSQSWLMAQETEKAIAPLKRATEMADDGKANFRLAQLYMSLYDWENAERELSKAIKKGSLDSEGNTLLLLGMVQFNQKKYQTALDSLAIAENFEKTKDLASQWLSYVASEKEKYELIQ